jgi:hypothetical protein
LANAIVVNTSFENTTSRGFTKDQLYSTASYKSRDLRGIRLQSNSLRNWDLSEQNLTDADLFLSTLTNVNFSDSNLTGAVMAPTFGTNLSGANLKNASLIGEDVDEAIVDGSTVYNQWTVFPNGYDPVKEGLRFEASPVGDFDAGGSLDVADVEALIDKIRGIHRSKSFSSGRMFDVNVDGRIDNDDLGYWVNDVKQTGFGDANLDGQFNSGDLIDVFQTSGFEDGIAGNATWSSGDWDADGEFTTSDLLLAFQEGVYEQNAVGSIHAVPEPSAIALSVAATIGALMLIRRRTPPMRG